jgi:hypothetical protein
MHGYGFLISSLAIGAFGVGFYKSGPMLDRLSVRLKDALERMRRAQ